MHYTTLLLDLDHTLFDTDTSEAAAFRHTLSAAGVSEPDRHFADYQRINRNLWAAVERGEVTPQHVRTRRFECLVAERSLDADPLFMAEAFVAGLAENGDLYAGAREVIERLCEHASLALVTNGLGEVQRARIQRVGIAQYFDAITVSAEVGAAKPGTEIFEITFQALDFPSKQATLMVGDSLSSDIRGGTNFGVATCWYNPSGKQAGPADRVVHDIRGLDELCKLVEK
jgi:YjjG family noncanonical pyrimidine nucleotidase